MKLVMAITVAIPAGIILLFILKNPYVGVILFFFLEYLRPYDLIPGLMKLRIAMLTLLVSLVAFIVLKARTDRSLRWDRFNWMYAGFLGVIAVTVFTSANNFLAYNTFYSMAINFLVFILATDLITGTSRLKKLLWLLLIIHAYHSANGILNMVTGAHVSKGMRTSGFVTSGFLKDENDFALAMNTFIPFAFFMMFSAVSRFKKFLASGILVALLLGVVSSMSRGGWIGLMAVALFLIWRSKNRGRSFAIVAILLVVAAAFAPAQYWDEISSISPTADTGEARIQYWQAAVRMFIDHPLVGVGGGNGGVWMPTYIRVSDRDPNTQWGATFHGTLPQVLAELGGLGMILYLGMLITTVKRLNRVRKVSQETEDGKFLAYMANSTLVGLIGYFVSAIFLSTAFYPQLWTLFIFTTVSYNLYRSMPAETEKTRPQLAI
jgi:probable O-glycosylation ligase (exosortase A-associated)